MNLYMRKCLAFITPILIQDCSQFSVYMHTVDFTIFECEIACVITCVIAVCYKLWEDCEGGGGLPTVYVFPGQPLDAKSQCRLKAVEERGSRST